MCICIEETRLHKDTLFNVSHNVFFPPTPPIPPPSGSYIPTPSYLCIHVVSLNMNVLYVRTMFSKMNSYELHKSKLRIRYCYR